LNDKPHVYFVPIGRVADDVFKRDVDDVEKLFEEFDIKLKRLETVSNELQALILRDLPDRENYDIALLLCLHGGTAHLQVATAECLNLPIVIWSLPKRFSFPTSASAYGALKERGFWVTLLQGKPDDKKLAENVADLARVAFAIRKLSRTRIGILGSLPHYMLASHYDAEILERRFGVKLRQLSHFEFMNVLESFQREDKGDVKQILQENVSVQTDEYSLRKGIAIHKAIKEILGRYKLDAIALGCHPDLEAELQINPCLGFVEDSYAIGCECDVLSLISALFLKYLGGVSAWITDIYSLEGNMLTLAHCAAASSLAKGGEVIISGKTQKEVGDRPNTLAECRPKIPSGTATLVRLLGKKADRLHLAFGDIENCDVEEQVKVKLKLHGNPEEFVKYAMGNHYTMALGDLREKVKTFCKRLDVDVIET
jgi:L-fucose isomerase-like protein